MHVKAKLCPSIILSLINIEVYFFPLLVRKRRENKAECLELQFTFLRIFYFRKKIELAALKCLNCLNTQ